MRPAFVFDLDDTLVTSKIATIAAYKQAVEEYNKLRVGEAAFHYDASFWGKTREEWSCPAWVHERKKVIFSRHADEIGRGWAWPMFVEALRRGERVEILTGASEDTVNMLLAHSVLNTLAPAGIKIITDASAARKQEYLCALSAERPVHYFDDLDVVDLSGMNVSQHRPHHGEWVTWPSTVSAVVLAAGRGERFKILGPGAVKPMIRFNGHTLVSYALGSAQEVSARPILVGLREVVDVPRPNVTEVEVRFVQRGPVESAELAGGHVPNNGPVIFMDSDVRLSPGVVYDFVQAAMTSKRSSSALVAPRGNRLGRYGGINALGEVVEGSAEVERCFVGVYFFRSWEFFKDCVAQTRRDRLTEIKFTDLLTWQQFSIHTIPTSDWTPLGSPEELAHAAGNE